MNRTQRRYLADAQLEALYAQIPEVNCKGHCHTTCGPIQLSNRERERIREAGVTIPEVPPGVKLSHMEPDDCPALTADKRCGVYEVRPFVCRLWGASEGLPCIYGCEVIGGEPVSIEDGMVLNTEVYNVGGWPPPNGKPDCDTSAEAVRERIRAAPAKMVMARADQAHGVRRDRERAVEKGMGHLLARRPDADR